MFDLKIMTDELKEYISSLDDHKNYIFTKFDVFLYKDKLYIPRNVKLIIRESSKIPWIEEIVKIIDSRSEDKLIFIKSLYYIGTINGNMVFNIRLSLDDDSEDLYAESKPIIAKTIEDAREMIIDTYGLGGDPEQVAKHGGNVVIGEMTVLDKLRQSKTNPSVFGYGKFEQINNEKPLPGLEDVPRDMDMRVCSFPVLITNDKITNKLEI